MSCADGHGSTCRCRNGIQLLLGHADLSHTTVYLHLSRRHLQAAPNPLEQLQVPRPPVLLRSRLKRKPTQS